MTQRRWVILGATSIIAEEFAHLGAKQNNNLLLVGRNLPQLEILAANFHLRYNIQASILCLDFTKDLTPLLAYFHKETEACDLFIAHSLMSKNDELDVNTIETLIQTNILSTIQIIHAYFKRSQTEFNLIFLSSVAACCGRNKNSLYGASKTAVEIYLQGLAQRPDKTRNILIARLGFIDTVQTYGQVPFFFASSPKACANACWHGLLQKKRLIYHPFFWRFIMGIIKRLPFFIYRRLNF